MSVETNKIRPTLAVLNALVDALRAIKLSAAEDAPAFEKVELFDLSDWEDALRRLALIQQRSALVIWTGEEYENNRESIILTTRRTQTIDLFISERRLDAPVAALTGDDLSPGVVGLKDLVLPAITGVLLDQDDDGNEAIYLTPQSVERGILSTDDKIKSPGRQILIINLQAQGEWMQVGVRANEAYP